MSDDGEACAALCAGAHTTPIKVDPGLLREKVAGPLTAIAWVAEALDQSPP